MSLYSHLKLSHAKTIIVLKNKGLSNYKISNITKISKGKIKRCLESCKVIKTKENIQKPWKGPHVRTYYSFKIYKNIRDQKKVNKAYIYASEAQSIYKPFVDFCEDLHKSKILKGKARRSALEYIKEYKRAFPSGDCPKKSWVYKMANSPHYSFKTKWLPSSKPKSYSLKSDDERKKPVKYTSIEERPDKELLRKYPGNFEIDSVIGKRTDKQALLTLIDIHSGDFYSRFYNRTMEGFRDSLKFIIDRYDLVFKSLTMDNGGENNKLGDILPKEIMFNCHPYCSGEKGTLENKHRLVRRILKKGTSLDGYTNEDLELVNKFVNNYYSKVFNKVK